jgi:hypothetical protein
LVALLTVTAGSQAISAPSMGVFERTREVGILSGRVGPHIRQLFSVEAVVLAVAGWASGVLLGWLIYQGLLALIRHSATVSLPQEFLPVIPLLMPARVPSIVTQARSLVSRRARRCLAANAGDLWRRVSPGGAEAVSASGLAGYREDGRAGRVPWIGPRGRLRLRSPW